MLNVLSVIFAKTEHSIDDKMITENALNLWIGCVLHRNELFNHFVDFKDDSQDETSIKDIE